MRAAICVLLIGFAGVGAQVFDYPQLNAHYETPAGWAASAEDQVIGKSIEATRVGLQPVYINILSSSSSLEANFQRGYICFWHTDFFYKSTLASTQAPILSAINDTVTESGIGYSMTTVKQLDQSRVMVTWASSFQKTVLAMTFITTLADFNTNESLYMQNWYNLGYKSLSPTLAKLPRNFSQRGEKALIVDALGRVQKVAPKTLPERVKIPWTLYEK